MTQRLWFNVPLCEACWAAAVGPDRQAHAMAVAWTLVIGISARDLLRQRMAARRMMRDLDELLGGPR